jgi:hypothetical protein
MTPFEYLSVLVSIIIGLGLTHLLTGAARLIQMRRRVLPFLPTYLWTGNLLLIQLQIWWSAYEERRETEWTFFGFLSFLLLPILISLVSYILIPDLEGEQHEMDLRASFMENRSWFHGLLATAVAISLGRDLLEDGRAALDLDAAFRSGFLLVALLSARARSEAFQLAGALLVFCLFCAYVLTLFVQLT